MGHLKEISRVILVIKQNFLNGVFGTIANTNMTIIIYEIMHTLWAVTLINIECKLCK